jgi:hypothetical protein
MTLAEFRAEINRIIASLSRVPPHQRRESLQKELQKLPAEFRDTALSLTAAAADAEHSAQAQEHLVVLIHGIRTHATWAEMVGGVLDQDAGAKAVPLKYGFFDLIKFLCPIRTRRAPIERLRRELRDLRAQNPTALISAVAHSFGTYALMKALDEPDIRLNRIILCGCIIKDSFRRARYQAQLGADPILNDCGTHDILPVLAKSVTWGYGATGTFGFGTVGIRDRFSKFGHSGCFEEQFVRAYWAPFIRDGTIHGTDWERARRTPPYWLSILSVVPLRYLILVCAAAVAVVATLLFRRYIFHS